MRSSRIGVPGLPGSIARVGILALAVCALGHPAFAQPAPKKPTTPASTPAPAKPGAGAPAAGAASPADEGPAPRAVTPSTPAADGQQGDVPVNVRLRRLEQDVQSLKERTWRSKARVGMLKEAVLGGGVGARATIVHVNKMGRAFKLVQLVYAIDGTQVFSRVDETGALHEQKQIEVLNGPLAPGNHTVSLLMVYRGSGFGPFKYLKKYKYTVKSSHTFTAGEGKATRLEIVGYEKGGMSTPLRDRPAVDFRVATEGGAPAGAK
jgi:hypothetical protein